VEGDPRHQCGLRHINFSDNFTVFTMNRSSTWLSGKKGIRSIS
jgi:hypothetical protein